MPRRATLLLALALALAAPATALAGAQDYEKLSASVRASMSRTINERPTIDPNDLETRAWVRVMAKRVRSKFEDEESARDFLITLRYESRRAGLDPHLMLALVDVESKFRRYAVSTAGALGYMQVMPFWVNLIGEPAHNLFQMKLNLRYGCTIFRHYLDRENGNIARALARYNGSLGKPEYPDLVQKAWKEKWAIGA
jgi:soluble lytic murein transglycosylase-like protein